MKYLIIILLLSLFSCTKEYSTPDPVIITITGTKYKTTVNGSYGDYWAIDVKISKQLPGDISVSYYFDDSQGMKRINLIQSIPKGCTSNIFYTQLRAIGVVENIVLDKVSGSNDFFSIKLI